MGAPAHREGLTTWFLGADLVGGIAPPLDTPAGRSRGSHLATRGVRGTCVCWETGVLGISNVKDEYALWLATRLFGMLFQKDGRPDLSYVRLIGWSLELG